MKAGIALAVAALLALAAVQVAPASSGEATATASKSARVKMVNFAFRPGKLRVSKGTRVVFVNRSSLPHTATRRGSFDTKRIRPGGRAAIRFRRKGKFGYICKLHPQMRGRIVVR